MLSLPLRAVFERLGERAVFVGLAISMAYTGILQSRFGGGRTLGKKLLGLRVVRLDGSLMSLDRSLVRYALMGLLVYQGAVAYALVGLLPFLGSGVGADRGRRGGERALPGMRGGRPVSSAQARAARSAGGNDRDSRRDAGPGLRRCAHQRPSRPQNRLGAAALAAIAMAPAWDLAPGGFVARDEGDAGDRRRPSGRVACRTWASQRRPSGTTAARRS